MRFLYLPLIFVTYLAAETVPVGTVLEVRLSTHVSTKFSRVGDPVRATLVAPVLANSWTLLPAGAELYGRVAEVRAFGWGWKNGKARLAYQFDRLLFPGGPEFPIRTRLVRVDTAKEPVDREGRVQGNLPAVNVSASMALYGWRLALLEPHIGAAVLATKFAFAPAPDVEIHHPAGAELLLTVLDPLQLPEDLREPAPAPLLSQTEHQILSQWSGTLPVQTTRGGKRDKKSDLVNLAFAGSQAELEQAFRGAGWAPADPRNHRNWFKTYFAVVERRGYPQAPVARLLLNGRPPDMVWQKSLNTFSKRHHLRVWQVDAPRAEGAPATSYWVAAATEDVNIAYSSKVRWFAHIIDTNIDGERAKVVNDLLFTGCVEGAAMIPRRDLQVDWRSSSGHRIQTDGGLAMLRLNRCSEPRTVPADAPAASISNALQTQRHPVVRFAQRLGGDFKRSNLVYVTLHNGRLVATKTASYSSRVLGLGPSGMVNSFVPQRVSNLDAPPPPVRTSPISAP